MYMDEEKLFSLNVNFFKIFYRKREKFLNKKIYKKKKPLN